MGIPETDNLGRQITKFLPPGVHPQAQRPIGKNGKQEVW
jgi:hypothetical protein